MLQTLPNSLSLSKDKIRVLLLEGVNDSAAQLLRDAGYTQVARHAKALDGAALAEALQGVHILGIRSPHPADRGGVRAADRLMAVGCFSVGTNQVELGAGRVARHPRVQRAVLQHPQRGRAGDRRDRHAAAAHPDPLARPRMPGAGTSPPTISFEVRGKTLGIVGYGSIGTQLSTLAEAMGMRVIYFDVVDKLRHGNTEPVGSLTELLRLSDVVSLHVPETAGDANMIGAAQFAAMKPGAYLINNSRGTRGGPGRRWRTRCAPATCSAPRWTCSRSSRRARRSAFHTPLQGLPNVILTPHIGGSTVEAQERIGPEVAHKLIDYSDAGSTLGAVNFPQVQLPPRPGATRYVHIHRNVPGMLGRVNAVFSCRALNISGPVSADRRRARLRGGGDADRRQGCDECLASCARWRARSGRG